MIEFSWVYGILRMEITPVSKMLQDEACSKSIRFYFLPEKPVMAGWKI
jgi:hypothetical protein